MAIHFQCQVRNGALYGRKTFSTVHNFLLANGCLIKNNNQAQFFARSSLPFSILPRSGVTRHPTGVNIDLTSMPPRLPPYPELSDGTLLNYCKLLPETIGMRKRILMRRNGFCSLSFPHRDKRIDCAKASGLIPVAEIIRVYLPCTRQSDRLSEGE
jgi:hypothetical protein